MASGKNHDKGIFVTAPLYLIGLTIITKDPLVVISQVSFYFFCGLFLSPDLDCPSLPYHRWGLLKYIWLPYQIIPHRGLSHWVIIGSLSRLLYLTAIIIGVSVGLDSISNVYNFDILWWIQTMWGMKDTPIIGGMIQGTANTLIYWVSWCFITCEITAQVHYFLDNLYGLLPKKVYAKLK